MLAALATISAVALLTIAGAFLWAINEELEDIRDLLRIALADAIRWIAIDESPSAKSPQIFDELVALTSEVGPALSCEQPLRFEPETMLCLHFGEGVSRSQEPSGDQSFRVAL